MTQHGGHIEVKTSEERGATFRIYLPPRKVEEIKVAEVEEDAVAVSPGREETILLVEDEDNIRVAAKRILESLGCQVLAAAGGLEALEMYQAAEKVDLMITDLVMPGMGGKELLRELKKTTLDLKALVITGYVSPETLQELKDEGFLNVVSKPFTVDVLTEVVHRALEED